MSANRIALVHEWVEKFGGAESVLDELVKLFPKSDLYVLWTDFAERYPLETYESFISKTFLRNHKAMSLPFQLAAWRLFGNRTKDYDKVIVSSHLFAHHIKLGNSSTSNKYIYTHTPARYIWEPERDTRGDNFLFRAAASLIKPLDRRRALEPLEIAANSGFTREKIAAAWDRDAKVIYPPVRAFEIQSKLKAGISIDDSELRALGALPKGYILGASRFIEYKKLDRVIEIGEWTDTPGVIAGSGPLLARLTQRAALAKVPVTIIQRPSDEMLLTLFANAQSYIFPPIEDFGVMPLEAGACGTPVLANEIGGSAETVSDGVNGWKVDMQSKSSILDGMNRITAVSSSGCISESMKFDSSVFREEILNWVRD